MLKFIILSLLVTAGSGINFNRNKRQNKFGDSVFKASMKLLKESFDVAQDKNVITSPLGVFTLLAMFSEGTTGKSREEIMKLLGFKNDGELRERYSSMINRFSSIDAKTMALANKIYLSNKYTLLDKFSKVVNNSYKSTVERLDFSKPGAAIDTINKWASEKTKGHIKKPVKPNMIDATTVAALFNVIYFQGSWETKFNASQTVEKDFYVDKSKTVKKPMMQQKSEMSFTRDVNLGAMMVELPYKEKGFRMVIFLPDKKDGLAGVLAKLNQYDNLEKLLKFDISKVELEMPKFEIKSHLDLNVILPKVGVSDIFSSGAEGIVRDRSVSVSKAFQDAFIKVNEEGSVAGAVTGVTITNKFGSGTVLFKVDHPFLFAILHEDIVLFAGTYTH